MSLLHWLQDLFFLIVTFWYLMRLGMACVTSEKFLSLGNSVTVPREGQSGDAPGVTSWELPLPCQHQRRFNLQTCCGGKTFPSTLKGSRLRGATAFAPGEGPREGWLRGGPSCHFSPAVVALSVAERAETHQRVKPRTPWPKDSHWWQVSEVSCFVTGLFLFAADSTSRNSSRQPGDVDTLWPLRRNGVSGTGIILWSYDLETTKCNVFYAQTCWGITALRIKR